MDKVGLQTYINTLMMGNVWKNHMYIPTFSTYFTYPDK